MNVKILKNYFRVERLAYTFYTNFNFLIPLSSQPDVKTLIFHTTSNKQREYNIY